MTPCLTAKAFFSCMFSSKMRRGFFLIAKYQHIFVQICLVQTGLFLSDWQCWFLMSTLLSAACHLVAMICIVTPWFICIDWISTDKLFWYSCLQFTENKQTNNSIQRVYYLFECLDWTRLVFRVLLMGVNSDSCVSKKIRDVHVSYVQVKAQVKVYVTLLNFSL